MKGREIAILLNWIESAYEKKGGLQEYRRIDSINLHVLVTRMILLISLQV